MDPRLKETQLKDKITYALALRFVNAYRIKTGVNPNSAIQNDQVLLANLVDELMTKFNSCEKYQELTSHHKEIKQRLND
jgi:hypothetical protein